MKQTSRPVLVRTAAGLTAALLAMTACGGSEQADPNTVPPGDVSVTSDVAGGASAPVETESAAQGLQQNGPIAVTGDPTPMYEESGDDPAIGTEAPVIEGESFDGTPITIGGPTENPTMVVFLAHWCPHCNDEIPVLVGLNDDGRFPDGLDVVGVSTAAQPDQPNYPPSEWIVDKDWPWPVMADDEAANALAAFGGRGFPYTVVFDTDGTVLARRSGEASADDTLAFLDEALGSA